MPALHNTRSSQTALIFLGAMLLAISLSCASCGKHKPAAPKTDEIAKYISAMYPHLRPAEIERADFLNDTGSEGRISIRANVVIKEALYVPGVLLAHLETKGVKKEDLQLVGSAWQALQAAPFFIETTASGSALVGRGELFCRNTVDGWVFDGELVFSPSLNGLAVAALPKGHLLAESDELSAFIASVKAAKVAREDLINSLESEKSRRVDALSAILKKGSVLHGEYDSKFQFELHIADDLHVTRDSVGRIKIGSWTNLRWKGEATSVTAFGGEKLNEKSPNSVLSGECWYDIDKQTVYCVLKFAAWDPNFNQYTTDQPRVRVEFNGRDFACTGHPCLDPGCTRKFGMTSLSQQ